MILYIENPNDSTKQRLELINEFNKVARYKINKLKPVITNYQKEKLRPGACAVGEGCVCSTKLLTL